MKGARVLVVDDSPTILKVVTGMLTRAGFVTQTARDGLVGIELIKRGQSFDLVLLDFVMPRMNGYQFCRELRSVGAGDVLPVVLMSAKADKIRDQFLGQTGAVGSLTKPFDTRSLLHAIDAAFAKASEMTEVRASILTDRADDADTKAGIPLLDEVAAAISRDVSVKPRLHAFSVCLHAIAPRRPTSREPSPKRSWHRERPISRRLPRSRPYHVRRRSPLHDSTRATCSRAISRSCRSPR